LAKRGRARKRAEIRRGEHILNRFVLIDPSISGDGGHYLEYARRVAHAAQKRGFEVVLGVNRAFDPASERRLKVEPVYTYDIWGNDISRQNEGLGEVSAEDRRALKRLITRSRLLYEIAAADGSFNAYVQHGSFPPREIAAIRRLAELGPKLRQAIQRRRNRGDRRTQAQEEDARRADLQALLRDGEALTEAPQAGGLYPTIERAAEAAGHFAATTEALFARLELGRADIVFLPTISLPDFSGLVSLLNRSDPDRLPMIAPLFRRNIFHGYPPSYRDEDYGVHNYRFTLAALRARAARRCTIFTDTDPLTEQYRQVSAIPVRTLPIPCPPTGVRTADAHRRGPIHLTYLGDARAEKGFDVLPRIAAALFAPPLRDRLKVVSQVYFPPMASDIAMMRAAEKLRLHSADRCELVEGALNSVDYARRLDEAGAVLIAYDRGNYQARSSGIFMEALAAGAPVVTTAGTWMSGVIDRLTCEYHQRAIREQEVLATTQGSEVPWRSYRPGRPEIELPMNEAGGVPVRPGDTTYTLTPAAPGATHLRLTFAHSPAGRGAHTQFLVSQRDAADKVVHERTYALGGSSSDVFSLALRLQPETRALWVGVSSLYNPKPYELRDVKLVWLKRTRPLARCAAGVTTVTVGEDPYDDLMTHALKELCDDYDEIARTSAEIAPAMAREHSADTLVERLMEGPSAPGAAARTIRIYPWR
jgi:glycosyltransferase involved in cell wall biosynthesis